MQAQTEADKWDEGQRKSVSSDRQRRIRGDQHNGDEASTRGDTNDENVGRGDSQREAGPEDELREGGAGSVFTIRISDEAFTDAMRAIYVQSLELGKVQSMRRAAMARARLILRIDQASLVRMLARKRPGWHKGDKIFYVQLSPREVELLRNTKNVIAKVDQTKVPDTLGELLSLAFYAGGEPGVFRETFIAERVS